MKSMMMLMAAAIPFATVAADSEIRIDAAKLRTAVPASALIDRDVTTSGEREAGEVEDIVISRDGSVRFFLLEVDDESALTTEQPVRDDETQQVPASGEWADSENLEERGFEVDEEMRAVAPADIRYTEEADDLLLSDNAQLHPVADDEDQVDGMRISEIIGMEVHMADEHSFGRVEDVMLTRDGSQVAALVVDNWDGLNKERRALPFDSAIVSYEEEEITFPYTEAQMEGVPEFNLDAYDDGF